MANETLIAPIGEIETKETSSGPLYKIFPVGSKLDYATREDEIVKKARALKAAGATAVWAFNPTETQRDGRTFKNRWLNEIEPWDGAEPEQQQLQPQSKRSDYNPNRDEKSMQILRQCASKVAAWTVPFLEEAHTKPSTVTPALMVELSEFWVAYYLDGPVGAATAAAAAVAEDPGPEDRPPPSDDEIPF